MRLLSLSLKNIGPFDEAHLEFLADADERPAVALLTGENGTGKSVIIDAIRALFGEHFCHVERALWRPDVRFQAGLSMDVDGRKAGLTSTTAGNHNAFAQPLHFSTHKHWLYTVPLQLRDGSQCPNWVVDYWRSTLATDSYNIPNLVVQNHRQYLMGALQGTHRNATVTELICHFDYLRDSHDPRERKAGEVLYETTKAIVQASLLDGGEFSHVARATFTPMVKQSGYVVPLPNLSSGNAYLIQRMISLLGKMYAVHVLRDTDPDDLCRTPGVLLIDEAENHFHPRWQKTFIPKILKIFPNLQIIATTHSPFILASVLGARVFVCRYDREKNTCVVAEETDLYANKPIEEILLSGAFNETQPFSQEISELIETRKRAIEDGNTAERRRIERLLQEKNPDYFSYFDIGERLRALGGGSR
jgi:hypothetical protein